MPKRPPIADLFASLIGDWLGVETVAPSEYNPDGAAIPVTYAFRLAASKTVVVCDYTQAGEEDAARFESHGVYRLDDAGDVDLYSFDASGMPPERFKGPIVDGKMELTAENAYGRWRLIQLLPHAGSFVSRLALWDDEAGWKLFSEGRYTRAE